MANKSLFLVDYVFRGKQCEKATILTNRIDSNSNATIFSSLIELFVFASLIGCYYNRRAKPDKDQSKTTKIFSGQFTSHENDVKMAYKFVLLTSNKECDDPIERLNRTFRNPEAESNYNLFEEFMLGGIDEIYDWLILDTNNRYEDYLTSINKLLSDIKKVEDLYDNILETDDFFKEA